MSKTKVFIAGVLRTIVDKLDPPPSIIEANPVFSKLTSDLYKPMVLACGYDIGEKELRESTMTYNKTHDTPNDKAVRDMIINEKKEKIKQGIFLAIEKDNLIDYRVHTEAFTVSGRLNLYMNDFKLNNQNQ